MTDWTIIFMGNVKGQKRRPVVLNNCFCGHCPVVVIIITIIYNYHAVINALSARLIHINLNILDTRRAQSYQNYLHKVLYGNTHTHTHMDAHNDCSRNRVLILVGVEIL